MSKLLGSALLVGGLVTVALPLSAQHKATAPATKAAAPATKAAAPAAPATTASSKYELGADFTAFYTKPSGVSGGVEMGLPVDVRIGFLSHSRLMWEPRLTFALNTIGTTTYTFAPGVNVLYRLKRGTGNHSLMHATYVTGGVALNLFDDGAGSGTQFSLGGGVGTRMPFQSAATRVEGFMSYTFKGGGLPSSFAIGTRLGLSFWH
jgi:hypothetical protein